MSDKKVGLEVHVHGNAEEKLEHLKHQAEELHKSIEKINGIGAGLLGAFGLGAGIFEIFDLVKESITEYRDMVKEEAKIVTLLKNTGSATKVTFEEIKEISEKIAHNLAMPTGAVEKVAASLINVGKIAKDPELFEKATKLTYDLSAATGKGPEESAKAIARLLQDPAKASKLLLSAGLATHEFTSAIKNAVKLGHSEEAQALVLDLLSAKYKDFAEEMAKKDPFFEFTQSLNDLKEVLGPLSTEVAKHLMPSIVEMVKKLTHWLESIDSDDITTFINGIKLATKALVAMAAYNVASAGWGAAKAVGGAAVSGVSSIATGIGGLLAGGALVEGIAAIAVPVLAIAGVAAAAYGLYQYIKGKDKDEIKNPVSEEDNNRLKYLIYDLETKQMNPKAISNDQLIEKFDKQFQGTEIKDVLDEHLKNKDFDYANFMKNVPEFLNKLIDPKNSKTLFTPSGAKGEEFNAVVKLFEDAMASTSDNKGTTAFTELLKKQLAFEHKYASELKVKGQSNKQFIININGGIGNNTTNEFAEGKDAASFNERLLIDSILKSLNALPGYTQ